MLSSPYVGPIPVNLRCLGLLFVLLFALPQVETSLVKSSHSSGIQASTLSATDNRLSTISAPDLGEPSPCFETSEDVTTQLPNYPTSQLSSYSADAQRYFAPLQTLRGPTQLSTTDYRLSTTDYRLSTISAPDLGEPTLCFEISEDVTTQLPNYPTTPLSSYPTTQLPTDTLPPADTLMAPREARSSSSLTDTIPPIDTLLGRPDSLRPVAPFSGTTRQFRVSEDSLEADVAYSSYDSMIVDFETEEIHLYGDASVQYLDINLTANHIVLNYGTNIVEAEPMRDSTGALAGYPDFSDGTQQFTADRIKYNFRLQKGIVYDAVTSQDDVIVRGGRSKFIQDAYVVDDTTTADVIYTEGAIFTTCTAEHPHFGIRTSRAKIVPGRVATIGASHLEIMGVPTPLWLPFGFFPLKSGRSTGLLFPRDFEYSPQWGLGLRDVGWFFPVGEYFNFSVLANYYVKGTWGLSLTGNYRRRYRYNGNFQFSYNAQRNENRETGDVNFDRSIIIRLTHNQDQAAHPSARLSGSINFQTNRAQSRVFNDFDRVSQNVINSNFNFTKVFSGAIPSTLTAGLSHTQNNQSREITVNFPDVSFQTQTIYPFRSNTGPERWYEKLQMRYTSEFRNTFQGSDTTFFSPETLSNAEYGFRHNVTAGLSFPFAEFFTFNPNVTYREVYYGERLNREFIDDPASIQTREIIDEEGNIVLDTIDYGTILESTVPGISSYRTLTAALSVQTQAFGTIRFGENSFIRGIRHSIKPTVSLAYQPSYIDNERYFDFVRDTTSADEFDRYSPFQEGIFGAPPATEQQLAMNYSITNLFEAKIWSKRDSTEKLVKLFNNINVNGSYNFQADSLRWSPVRVSGNTRFFKGVTSLNLRAQFDPYVREFRGGSDRGVRVDRFAWDERGVPLLLDNFSGTITTNITVAKIRQLFQGAEEEVVTDVREQRRRQRDEENTLFEETDFLSLFENFSIRHNFNFSVDRLVDQTGGGNDTLRFDTRANSIELRGNFQLSDNWQVNIGSIGYDFVSERITYPFLTLTRDLHCWEMRFSWAPVRNTFTFNIAVKPGTFDFIKVPVRRNQADGGNLFGS